MKVLDGQTVSRQQDEPTHHLYRLLWRWHFYAALFVMPFLVVLGITGTLYCFQPQIEPLLYPEKLLVVDPGTPRLGEQALLDRARHAAPIGAIASTVSIDTRPARSAEFIFKLPSGESESLYLNPYDGSVLGTLSVEHRLMQQIRMLHRGLLIGKPGELLMELAGCWTLIMLGTGLALWWPRASMGRRAVLTPRRPAQGRVWWRELHSAIGIWLACGALAFVLTGLPWTSTWGEGFKALVTQAGMGYPVNAWAALTVHSGGDKSSSSKNPSGNSHETSNAMPGMVMDDMPVKQVPWAVGLTPVPRTAVTTEQAVGKSTIPLDKVIDIAASKGVQSDYQIVLPTRPDGVFTVSYFASDPRQERTIHIDRYTGEVLEDIDFAKYGVIADAISFGTALHMGRYFGLANQIICTVISLGLVALSVSGCIVWLKRRPAKALGAPMRPLTMPPVRAWIIGLFVLACIFPLLGVSLAAVWLLDWRYGQAMTSRLR